MRNLKIKLTTNFNFVEFVEGKTQPAKAIHLNYNYLALLHVDKFRDIIRKTSEVAGVLQALRNDLNENFRDRNGGNEIRIVISCGGRTREWDVEHRNRSGESQHVYWNAADFYVDNIVSDALYNEVMDYAYKWFVQRNWMGGLAKRLVTLDEIQALIDRCHVELAETYRKRPWRFLHLDNRKPNQLHVNRGYGARWKYPGIIK